MRTCLMAWALALITAGTPGALAQPTPPPTPSERAREARSRLADLLTTGPVQGRFVERVPGSYVFVPRSLDLSQATVSNPAAVGPLATGPLLEVKGKLDADGRLEVESYELTPPPSARGPDRPPSVVAAAVEKTHHALRDAIRPGTRDIPERGLESGSLPARIARESIRTLVNEYQKAVESQNAVSLAEIVREWADLRSRIVDFFAFSEDTEYKALYGQPDNYAPWRYDRIYQQTPAVVAIGEPGATTARCSGVLIGPDLVLTAAHCFAGPPPKEPRELEVWFDYVERPSDEPPAPIHRRRIDAMPVAPPPGERWRRLMAGTFDADRLDYAIVRFTSAEGQPPIPNAAQPQCLRRTPLHRGEAIYIVGYPRGDRATVHDNARVYLPHRVQDGPAFFQLRLDVEADLLGSPERLTLMEQFDASYEARETSPAGIAWRVFHDIREGGQPRMGVVADTFRGNSGGPVYDHHREQCVVGILILGATDTGVRRTPSWKEHERVLPIRAILDDLERDGGTAPLVRSLKVRD